VHDAYVIWTRLEAIILKTLSHGNSSGPRRGASLSNVFGYGLSLMDDSENVVSTATLTAKWAGAILSEEKINSVWSDSGPAHGFVYCQIKQILNNKCTDYYDPSPMRVADVE